MENENTIGSLFSGIGGIEIGFEQQGFNTIWFVENDEYAQSILKRRFPEAIVYGDIKDIDFRTVSRVDILTGGFPCQDISNAGKRIGISGSRSSLWKYYKEAIRILRPKFAVIENVSALADRGLDVVLADLAEVGYDAEWYNISASSVGAFHRRERLFVLAYPNSSGHVHRQIEINTAERREYALCESKSNGAIISNTNDERFQGEGEIKVRYKELSDTNDNYNRKQRQESIQEKDWRGYWESEPRICRVANGIPNRVDRIRCLGNAVVPQVAEVFAQAILKQSEGKE